MLNLLIKDFKLMFVGKTDKSRRILYFLTSALFVIAFVAIETFLYSAILMRIKDYSGAPITFTCLFLSVISAFMIINGVSKAITLFFDKKDVEQLSTHPIGSGMLIGSKLVFLLFNHFITAFIFVFPIFAAYGTIFSKNFMFFYLAAFYPLLSFLFEVGLALILVYPVRMVLQFLKRHVILEFVLASGLLFALAFAYSKVLGEFINMVVGNNVSLLFTEESMRALSEIKQYLIPMNFLTTAFIGSAFGQLVPYLCISTGVFIFGASLSIITFNHARRTVHKNGVQKGHCPDKPRSVVGALARKEMLLLLKDHGYIFSFSGLLVVQPFLLYLIIVAMRAIFNSGTFLYYTTLFPNFAAFVLIFMVIMVTLIINAGANHYLTMEEKTVKILKTVPVSYRKQLFIKVAIPFLMSLLSLAVSIAVIMISGVMSAASATFAFVLSVVALVAFDAVSMTEELQIRHGKPRSSFISTMIAYLLPIVFMITGLVLSYLGVSLVFVCLVAIVVFLTIGALVLIRLWLKMGEWFMLLETLY